MRYPSLCVCSRWLGPLALALGLTACASAPPAPPPLATPLPEGQRWRAPTPGAEPGPLLAWWRVFNDEHLTHLIERALQTHTSVRSAQAALVQARAQRDVASAATLPGLRASASAQRSATAQRPTGNAFRAGLDASWEWDVWALRRSALGASEADLHASAAQLGQARVTLAAEVALTYLEWRTQQQRLQVARDNLALQEASLQLTRWRAEAGLASQLELTQALAAVGQTRAAVAPLEAGVQQHRNALAALAMGSPQAELGLPEAGSLPQVAYGLALAIPADTLRQRPDIRLAEARVVAALARTAQADAARHPSLSLGGSLDWRAPRLTDLFDAGALTRALVASVTASLWDGGLARAQLRAQEAVLEQARVAWEAAISNALQEVEAALWALQASRQRLDHLLPATAAAVQAESLARQRHASGLIDTRALLEAQRTRLHAESDLAAARATWSADHVRLYKALGGGWSHDTLTQDLEAPLHAHP
jgi:outer membrane protein, multidrug efflux system